MECIEAEAVATTQSPSYGHFPHGAMLWVILGHPEGILDKRVPYAYDLNWDKAAKHTFLVEFTVLGLSLSHHLRLGEAHFRLMGQLA